MGRHGYVFAMNDYHERELKYWEHQTTVLSVDSPDFDRAVFEAWIKESGILSSMTLQEGDARRCYARAQQSNP